MHEKFFNAQYYWQSDIMCCVFFFIEYRHYLQACPRIFILPRILSALSLYWLKGWNQTTTRYGVDRQVCFRLLANLFARNCMDGDENLFRNTRYYAKLCYQNLGIYTCRWNTWKQRRQLYCPIEMKEKSQILSNRSSTYGKFHLIEWIKNKKERRSQ